jgi:hypothetical protein
MNDFWQTLVAGTFSMANDRSRRTGLKGDVCAE